MNTLQHETLSSLLEELKVADYQPTAEVDKLAEVDHRYLRDLRINVTNALKYDNLSKKESYLLALAVAINEKHATLKTTFEALAKGEGATDAELAETVACVSLLNVNNVFYRFRHFTKKEYYEQTPAGIKMSIMMNPVLGKEFFELMSLGVSALNGCEMCVNAHEESILKVGGSQARIYDAVRLTAIIKGLTAIF
ncbi:carboxymuconolactone decarboxylase family protein [Xanthocytophaga agilis]|uniref:Alkyl hydroperoxide reductase AhpD n=1 Tax=Xanthocytophaga agilis TaxID=3048010 RepID=A0AAE3R3E9_9BACT|nr:carboxymuconolactone decarboxylase family protein [Xanthocytophaga agilis]MDJ1500634.1 carboxymuconolactone decarboxylase family protein [Xanthocytophaga agilis]